MGIAGFCTAATDSCWGYTAEGAVSEEGLIVAARVTQAANDHASLLPLVQQSEQRCGRRPEPVLADAGFYSNENVQAMEARGVELYLPDSVLAREMKQGRAVRGAMRICDPGLKRMRQRLTAREEPVFPQLKTPWRSQDAAANPVATQTLKPCPDVFVALVPRVAELAY
jgi:Transposase DDE domain